jgi:hypothetical protein
MDKVSPHAFRLDPVFDYDQAILTLVNGDVLVGWSGMESSYVIPWALSWEREQLGLGDYRVCEQECDLINKELKKVFGKEDVREALK